VCGFSYAKNWVASFPSYVWFYSPSSPSRSMIHHASSRRRSSYDANVTIWKCRPRDRRHFWTEEKLRFWFWSFHPRIQNSKHRAGSILSTILFGRPIPNQLSRGVAITIPREHTVERNCSFSERTTKQRIRSGVPTRAFSVVFCQMVRTRHVLFWKVVLVIERKLAFSDWVAKRQRYHVASRIVWMMDTPLTVATTPWYGTTFFI